MTAAAAKASIRGRAIPPGNIAAAEHDSGRGVEAGRHIGSINFCFWHKTDMPAHPPAAKCCLSQGERVFLPADTTAIPLSSTPLA